MGFFVENYRAFSRRQNIDIRPLTLFFGWNSSGKSALVRFLPLVAESVRNAGPPVWLAGEIGRGATWSELVCQATQRDILRFGIRWDDSGKPQAEWDVKGDLQEGRWQEIESLRWIEGDSSQTMNVTNWRGPVPMGSEGKLNTLFDRLHGIADQVQWISAPSHLPPNGKNAIEHLIAAHVRDEADPIIDFARIFFDSLGEQLVLDNPLMGLWRVLLQPKGHSQVRVNLDDAGEGYTQVLPVLVALARACTGGPRLVCLEQPELHLHTRAQEALTQVLIHAAQSKSKPCFLVETHSEVLLRSVQLAIAKGDIPHDHVRVYWVESISDGTSDAVAVDFNDLGKPNNSALMGAFEEAIRLGKELAKLQLPKARP
jgi:hypothetical protein